MKRRKFLWYTSALSASLLIPVISCKNDVSNGEFISIPLTLSNIYDKETIIKVGTEYIELYSEEGNKEKLEYLLKKDFLKVKDNEQMNVKELSNIIYNKIKLDFKEGNTVIVDGWILSKTEARQCAYYSLTN